MTEIPNCVNSDPETSYYIYLGYVSFRAKLLYIYYILYTYHSYLLRNVYLLISRFGNILLKTQISTWLKIRCLAVF